MLKMREKGGKHLEKWVFNFFWIHIAYDARCERSYNCTHIHISIHSQDTFHISTSALWMKRATKAQSLLGAHLKRTGHCRLHKLIACEIACSNKLSIENMKSCKNDLNICKASLFFLRSPLRFEKKTMFN